MSVGFVFSYWPRVKAWMNPSNRARIAPFHRRIGHPGQGHVKIKRRSRPASRAAQNHHQPFAAQPPRLARKPHPRPQRPQPQQPADRLCRGRRQHHEKPRHRPIQAILCNPLPGQYRKPGVSRNRAHAHNIEDDEYRLVLLQRRQDVLLLEHQAGHIDNAVVKKQVPPQPRIRRRDRHLDPHRRHDQRLVVREAQTVEEQRQIQIPPLLRRINPPHQAQQHHHQRRHAERIHLHNHRLAPHEPVVPDQHPGNEPRHHANCALPAPGYRFEVFDALDQQAAAPRHQQPQQPRRQRPARRFRQRHPPGDVLERHQHRPQPGVNRPHRVAWRVRNPRIKRAGSQLPGVLQRQLRRQRQVIPNPHRPKRDQERQPINPPKQPRRAGGGEGKRIAQGRHGGWVGLWLLRLFVTHKAALH